MTLELPKEGSGCTSRVERKEEDAVRAEERLDIWTGLVG